MHRDHPDPMRLGLLGLGWVWVGFGMVWFGLGLFWIGFGLGWAWLGSIRFDFPDFAPCPFNSAVCLSAGHSTNRLSDCFHVGRCMDWVSQVHDGTNGVGMRAGDTPRNGGPGALAFSPILKRVGATVFGRFDCIL